MSNMGYLKQDRDDSGVVIYGHIATLRHDVRFMLEPTGEDLKGDAKGVGHFRVMGRTPAGTPCQIGRGWQTKGKSGDNAGKVNYRLWLDDETFGKGVGVSAYPDGSEPGRFRLVKSGEAE
jgi:uncharacterized protein (DUF736 family)